METYPVLSEEGRRTAAFEFENIYIGLGAVARLLVEVEGVTNVRPRKMFAKVSDVHIEFTYLGCPYVVWEPWGDNSRYWIGPEEGAEAGAIGDVTLENAFKRYKPPVYRTIFGDVLTLRFITRLFKRGR
jgi:hypothetical protein